MVHLQRTSDEKRPGQGRQRINPREFATTGPKNTGNRSQLPVAPWFASRQQWRSVVSKNAFSTPFQGILPPSGPRIIAEGWQGVLRHAVLEAMPVGELAENFSRELGAPTKGAEGTTHFLAPRERGCPLSTPPCLTPHASRSSGSAVDAARRAGYPWPEKLGPQLVEKSREKQEFRQPVIPTKHLV